MARLYKSGLWGLRFYASMATLAILYADFRITCCTAALGSMKEKVQRQSTGLLAPCCFSEGGRQNQRNLTVMGWICSIISRIDLEK